MSRRFFSLWSFPFALVLVFMTVLVPVFSPAHAENSVAAAEPMILTITVPGRDMATAMTALNQAITSHNYTFVREQAMDSRLVPYAEEVRSVRLVYFCNFAKMNHALKLDPRAAQMLPCRVTLVETPSGVDLIVINPAWVSQNMGNPALHAECMALKQDYLAILDEASL